MIKHITLGWPVVTSRNCFDVIRSLGIRPWPQLEDEEPLAEYLTHATQLDKNEAYNHGPKVVVARHRNPHKDQFFNAFRVKFRPVATVFALIENYYVPVTAEWKHGNNKITIVPPSGIPGQEESGILDFAKKMEMVARREWVEETGTKLTAIKPLTPDSGLWTVVRNADICYSLFFGTVEAPVIKGPTKFDGSEHLKMVLFPIPEWMRLIQSPELWNANPDFGLEQCAIDATFLGLMKKGNISVNY